MILEIIKIVCTAIISIASTLLAVSCTASLSVVKHSSNVHQDVKQKASVDSTVVSPIINN